VSTPDVRVRFSPEGISQVIDGIRRMRAEGDRADKSSKTWTTSIGVLRGSLGALGIATSISGVVAFGKAAVLSAKQTVDAAKTLRVSTEEYSRLEYAARSAQIGTADFASGLERYQTLLSRAITDPSSEASRAFTQLGLSAKDLQRLGLADQIKTIADRIAALGSPTDQIRASVDIFSRSIGPQLARVLAGGGAAFDRFADQSDRAGYTLKTNTAEQIDRTTEKIERLKTVLTSMTRRGLAGLADIVAPITPTALEQLADATATLSRLRSLAAQTPEQRGNRGVGVDFSPENIRRLEQRVAELRKEAGVGPRGGTGAGRQFGATLPVDDADADKAAKAATERARAAIENQLRITQEGFNAQAAADKRAYEQGLVSLTAYYERRRAAVEAGRDAEVAAAQAQIAVVQGTPPEDEAAKAAQAREVEKLRADITLARAKAERELADLRGEEVQQQKQLANEQADLYARLGDLEGNRHALFERNLEEEIQALRELLTRAGAGAEEIAAAAERLRRARTANFDFDQSRTTGQSQLAAFDRDAAQIRRDQEAGIITQLEGENRLIALQRQRLTVLQQMADAMLRAAAATGDPANVEQARQYADSVAEIVASFRAATDVIGQFRQGAETGLRDAFRGLADDATLGRIKSLGDAFWTLAGRIGQALSRIAADLISRQLTAAVQRFMSGFSGKGGFLGFLGGVFGGAKNGGELQKLAGGGAVDARPGGQVFGPGTPTSDDVLLWGSRKEFMVRAAAAQQPGGLSLLHAINSGRITAETIRRALRIQNVHLPRFAAGGALSGQQPQLAAAAPGGGNTVHVHLHGVGERGIGRQSLQQIQGAVVRGLAIAAKRE
jgi:hypothetical protein